MGEWPELAGSCLMHCSITACRREGALNGKDQPAAAFRHSLLPMSSFEDVPDHRPEDNLDRFDRRTPFTQLLETALVPYS